MQNISLRGPIPFASLALILLYALLANGQNQKGVAFLIRSRQVFFVYTPAPWRAFLLATLSNRWRLLPRQSIFARQKRLSLPE